LPKIEGEVSAKRKFKAYPIGYFHIDIAKVRTAEGKLYMFVAIDRMSKFAFVELHERATTRIAADLLFALIKAYKIHTVLTDNGTHFTDPGGETWSPPEIKQMLARGTTVPGTCFRTRLRRRRTSMRTVTTRARKSKAKCVTPLSTRWA
jgi:hypothetical protein